MRQDSGLPKTIEVRREGMPRQAAHGVALAARRIGCRWILVGVLGTSLGACTQDGTQSPFTLEVTDSDWGQGQALDNQPDDVSCGAESIGFFGAMASFSCEAPQVGQCTCG